MTQGPAGCTHTGCHMKGIWGRHDSKERERESTANHWPSDSSVVADETEERRSREKGADD